MSGVGGKGFGVGWGGRGVRTMPQRIAWMLLSMLLRRQAIFLFAPLLYISGMLLYMGSVSLDVVPQIIARPVPGSVYRSPQLYHRFRGDLDLEDQSVDEYDNLSHYMVSGEFMLVFSILVNENSKDYNISWWFLVNFF